VEVATGVGVMRSLDRSAEAVPVAAVPTTDRRATSARRRALAWAAAAVLLVAVAVSATVIATRDHSPNRTVVVLAPVSNQDARGNVAMQARNGAQDMVVRTTLGAAPRASYYEVWLLERGTGKMLPVGVLPPDGNGEFRLSSDILQGYDTVDISLQPNNGDTAHSNDSLLRADYA
jgi:anti-sigma-K factor RskA